MLGAEWEEGLSSHIRRIYLKPSKGTSGII